MEAPLCNLCGSPPSDHRKVLEAQDRRYGTPGRFALVRCRRCDLCFVSPRPTPEEIGGFYPDSFGEHSAAAMETNDFAAAGAEIVVRHQPNGGAILDVGCAAGGFLRAMSARGWQVSGIEVSPAAASLAATVTGARVHTGWVDNAPFDDEAFDAVSAWSVLEHLHDPLANLTRCRDLLRPGGQLYLGLPNFASIERVLFGERWFALDVPRHLYHFTPATLRELLGRAGFSVVSLRQASGHDTFQWSVQLLRGRTPALLPSRPQDAVTERPHGFSKLMSAAKGGIVQAVTSTADRLGYGSQMLVVARR